MTVLIGYFFHESIILQQTKEQKNTSYWDTELTVSVSLTLTGNVMSFISNSRSRMNVVVTRCYGES